MVLAGFTEACQFLFRPPRNSISATWVCAQVVFLRPTWASVNPPGAGFSIESDVISRIHEIRSERAKINDRVQALAKLEAENGSLTAELQAQFEAMSGQIAHLESAARMNAAAAVPVSAATDVTATMTVPSQPK